MPSGHNTIAQTAAILSKIQVATKREEKKIWLLSFEKTSHKYFITLLLTFHWLEFSLPAYNLTGGIIPSSDKFQFVLQRIRTVTGETANSSFFSRFLAVLRDEKEGREKQGKYSNELKKKVVRGGTNSRASELVARCHPGPGEQSG